MAARDSLDRSSSEIDGTAPNVSNNGNEPQNATNDYPAQQSASAVDESSPAFESVLNSDIGVSTLLSRLKQSVTSAREFAAFLKKRSMLEEEHAQGLKKLCRSTHDSTRRQESRQFSYSQSYEEITHIHERMADNGIQFALSLHQMHEDLQELAADKERSRKHWKQTGLNAEKRVQDAESAMEKAKSKYDSYAEDYDRARTGDKQSGRVFGLKGPKSAAQVEEDLYRKVQAADSDYSSKVQGAQTLRQELITTSRPQAVKALQDIINECDSGLTLQLQKFASFNEKLLLSNGLCVSPLKGPNNTLGSSGRSLRDVVYQVDNERDLQNYVISFAPKVGPRHAEIKYERHPTLLSSQQVQTSASLGGGGQTQVQSQQQQPPPPRTLQQVSAQNSPSQNLNHNAAPTPPYTPAGNERGYNGSPRQQNFPLTSPVGASQIPSNQVPPPSAPPPSYYTASSLQNPVSQSGHQFSELPPLKPVFGVSLEDLFKRDNSAVPMVVYQCLQAVDLFGLEVEGIYRLSGTASQVTKLRSIFDNDSSQVDFRNPENFYHDVNNAAGLLKQFFRDLPDPLLTREHYQGFIEAARIDDDVTRRDSLHATINSLPDPNYATLRALTLHLNRVQEHSGVNRMNAGNLAICFGPTLMGSNTGPNIADAGWQVRVIDTILQNTYQIFDDD